MGRPSAIVSSPTAEAYVLYEKYQDAALGALWRFYPQYANDEDFQQIARIGLWRACCEYDPTRGAFLTIAYKAVWSEIGHHFRIKGAQRRLPDELLVELDAPRGHTGRRTINDESHVTLLDLLPDKSNLEWVDLQGFLNALDDQHLEIVQLRLEGYTLQEIGQRFGVTRERIRQKLAEIRPLFARYV